MNQHSIISDIYRYFIPLAEQTTACWITKSNDKEISWKVFYVPFTEELWEFLLVYALIIALFIKSVQFVVQGIWFNTWMKTISDIILYYWTACMSFFGKGPPKIDLDDKTPLRIFIFSVMLAANIIWMCFR